MKRVVKYILFILVIVVLLSFKLAKGKSLSLAELYDLDQSNQIESVLLLHFSDVNLLDPEWKPSIPEPQREINVEKIKPFYDYLREVEITKVKSEMNIEVENLDTYNIAFKFDDSSNKSNFSIDLGEHYIIIRDNKESGMYKHNLTNEKYMDLINILEKCIE